MLRASAVTLTLCLLASSYAPAFGAMEEENELLGEIPVVMVASQQVESMNETPVITNVVTAEEIRRMGARTLNDVLLTIPGFSHIQDHNEYFSAERGIYASAQQKVLVLRDGQRLNNRSYSEANFDYSINLDNVKRIEILRGPGGSLYGDVALTAVVNIVTKDGKDIGGMEATLGAGNYGQQRFSFTGGKELGSGKDFVFSGSIFQDDGQKVSFADPRNPAKQGTSVIYGFRDTPAYDTYLKFHSGELGVLLSRRYSHYLEPRTGGGITGEIMDIDSFAKFNGETPGLSTLFNNAEVSYAPKIDDYNITSKVYYGDSQVRANLTTNATTLAQGDVNWREWVGGVQTQASRPYSLLGGEGTILAGAQFEHMEVFDSGFPSGVAPNFSAPIIVLKRGKENTTAVYTQAKHNIIKGFIANIGLRYDYKQRREDVSVSDVSQLSPRAALIYLPNDKLSFRLSYGHSFVDAPYWYRYNTLPSYQGALSLKPEELNTYQFSVENNLLGNMLTNRVNFFYNDFSNVIFRNTGGAYTNAGSVKSNGIEYEIGYRREDLSTKANYTYQSFTEVTGYWAKDYMMESVPQHMANLIVDYAPLHSMQLSWGKDLWLNASLRYVGDQRSRWGKALANAATTVDSALIANAGFTVNQFICKDLSLGFHAYNLFDKQYYQGGSVEYPFLQPGAWYMGEVTYKW